jgi:serine/threonine-protein kinase RsbW
MEAMNHDSGRRIELSLPSESRYMRLARLMASGVATSCGLPLEEVEDFRIAIDEVCSALVELSDGDALRLAFEPTDHALVVVGTTTAAPGGSLDDERLSLSRQILEVVTDDHTMHRSGDTVSFTARERLRGRGVG